jgi:hypothetical protein
MTVPAASYDDWLRVARRHLTRPLFGSLDRLHALATHCPEGCLGALEVHLGKGGGAIDLSIRLEEPEQARSMAEQPLPARLRSFLCRWSEAEGPFSSIPCVWLEFDLDRPGVGFLTPSVCARLPRGSDLDWIVESLLPALHGGRLSGAQRRLVRHCHAEIPVGSDLLYVFSLLSRPGCPVRLEIFGLDPDGALDYLRRVAPHAAPALAGIAPLFEGIERPHLSFDIGREILPRVGLEGSFARQHEPRWTELFARLVARGLCTPGEMDAILAWPGYDTFWTAATDWPLEQVGMRGFCVRSLSHVKMVAQPRREPEAKVYLLVSYVTGANSSARRSVFST